MTTEKRILAVRRRYVAARPGFTLIEVMIVIAIILFLGGIVGIALFAQRDAANKQLVQTQLGQIGGGLKAFRLVYDRYPTDEEGLAVLWSQDTLDAEADAGQWRKFLDKPLPNDLWGRPWGYRQVSENGDEDDYDLWSVGKDGEEGTDDDITSWKQEGSEEGDMSTSGPPPSRSPGG